MKSKSFKIALSDKMSVILPKEYSQPFYEAGQTRIKVNAIHNK